ncbi:hypothetical protein TRIP_B330238 [uncultured Desulfatiglans sp.]|uniref:Uncharacterized protein n=1 Tax=Uncultured Desulfatiglans sp. TaxID=1748965 RepID=A0A653A7M7_UNCDX|nr:hypothetical protein TRIP_B330238 [uncultured Desulfatiglans sp.]
MSCEKSSCRAMFKALSDSFLDPGLDVLFAGDFADRLDFTVHNDSRRDKDAVAGDLHGVGDLFDLSGDACFLYRLLDDFFRLAAFRAAGAQDFDFHLGILLFFNFKGPVERFDAPLR